MDDGTRTRDGRNHNPGLYQLSYVHHRRTPAVARPAGIEPATAGLEGRCSIRLSYGRFVNQSVTAPIVIFQADVRVPRKTESEVRAATVALAGVQKEAAGGQRTTVDVLNSQQDLISAKARLIGAQRDRVIASYTLLSAIGRLDVKTLALNTPDYLPEVHYHQVRDAWHGLRTPSGQ